MNGDFCYSGLYSFGHMSTSTGFGTATTLVSPPLNVISRVRFPVQATRSYGVGNIPAHLLAVSSWDGVSRGTCPISQAFVFSVLVLPFVRHSSQFLVGNTKGAPPASRRHIQRSVPDRVCYPGWSIGLDRLQPRRSRGQSC